MAVRRQVIDIPATPYEVVEHQILELVCSCGQVHASAFPSTVTVAVQYDSNVKALAVHLIRGQMLPYARTAAFKVAASGCSPGRKLTIR